MEKSTYLLLENYMKSCMGDSAHDKEHVYRVLYTALDIAQEEGNVDYDILITACLLHDIGRKEQFENPKCCHAQVGAQKAFDFLINHNFDEAFAEAVRDCIQTHRYRRNNLPQTKEAKILFDADKLDACGAIGIARTLIYKGRVEEPLYSLDAEGKVSDGSGDDTPSFFQEYKYKLENIYDHFFTKCGAKLARMRQAAAVAFYDSMLAEVKASYEAGAERLGEWIS